MNGRHGQCRAHVFWWQVASALLLCAWTIACTTAPSDAEVRAWERDNPIQPIPDAPLGTGIVLSDLPDPPTPARVRLGRWLFFDRRLSSDASLSCASCHQPEHAFSQTTPVATGVHGRTGVRKVPPIINLAVPQPPTAFASGPQAAYFWDGRASSLERQVLEPVANSVEMGSDHRTMVSTLSRIGGYRRYFLEAFGNGDVTTERVARAIADYERTRMSGNSPYDRWRVGKDEDAMSAEAKRGFDLFVGKARCLHCHSGPLFTNGHFFNLGVGWDPATNTFADQGRHAVTKGSVYQPFPGTFKVPTLREVTRHPPYMHDGSLKSLRAVVEFYNRGGIPNLYQSPVIQPLGLSEAEISALLAFLGALEGEGWQDRGPALFPR
jgi:cytochrome c peroxidase